MKKRRHIPFWTTSPTEDLCWTILFIPLWWILGIKFFIFHLIALFIFTKLVVNKRKKSKKIAFPTETFFLLAFIIVYSLSLLVNFKTIPIWRFFASLNNLSFWIMGFLIVSTIYNSINREDIASYLRTFRNFGVINSVFTLCTLLLSIILHRYLDVETLLFKLLPDKLIDTINNNALLLKSSLFPNIVVRTGIFRMRRIPRPEGFTIYATALGVVMLFLIVMTIAYYKINKKKKGLTIILILEFLTLFVSLSRNPILGLFLAWLVVFIITNIQKSLALKIITVVMIALLILIFLIPHNKIASTIIGVRQVSTLWRFDTYKATFNQATEKPLLGYGFKPGKEESGIHVPIGSHSMYFGSLYKTGFLGFLFFILFWLSILWKWVTQMNTLRKDKILGHLWFYSGIAFIGGLLWMVTEDLDAPPVVAFLYFIIIGLIISLNNLKKSPTER
jgi:O-antigen ligase